MWYNIKFNDNLITVTNLTVDSLVKVTITLSETCSTNFTDIVKDVNVNSTKEFKLPPINGLYHIKLTKITGDVEEYQEYNYPYFGILLKSIIEDFDYFFCGCGCKDCDDCGKDENSKLMLVMKVMSYFTLTYKYFPRFYDAIFKCLYCDTLDISNCEILAEQLTGNSKPNLLFNKLLASFYLCFYFIEYYSNDDIELVNKKFKYNNINQCIKSANADIDCIKNNIENNMGLFTVNFGAYVNQPPDVVGDYSTSAANRAELTLSPGQFTTLTTPAYHDPEGDAAQAIRIDTLPTNGALLTFNGSTVTVGQVVLISDIAANKLKLKGPNQDALATTVFNFSVRDTGSMQFTS